MHSGNLKKVSLTVLLKKFRQSNFFTKELYCKLILRKFFEVRVNFRHYHTVPWYSDCQGILIFAKVRNTGTPLEV